MIETVHIENFRGFRKLSLSGARPLNLIVGKNNSGKSSLLEAIYIAAGGPNPEGPFNVAILRGENYEQKGVDHMWRPLFRGLSTAWPVVLRLKLSEEAEERSLTLSALPEKGFKTSKAASDQLPPSMIHPSLRVGGLRFEYRSGSGETQVLTSEFDATLGTLSNPPVDRNNLILVTLVSPMIPLFPSMHVGSYSRLRQDNRHFRVIELLKIVEPALVDIEVLAIDGNASLFAQLSSGEKIPASHMGEGFLRIFQLAVVLVSSPDGAVFLFDEPEAGLHHSLYDTLWNFLSEAASKWGIQVFATTHSDELLRAGLSNESVRKVGLGLFRIDRTEAGHTVAAYGEDAMDGVLYAPFEVRA